MIIKHFCGTTQSFINEVRHDRITLASLCFFSLLTTYIQILRSSVITARDGALTHSQNGSIFNHTIVNNRGGREKISVGSRCVYTSAHHHWQLHFFLFPSIVSTVWKLNPSSYSDFLLTGRKPCVWVVVIKNGCCFSLSRVRSTLKRDSRIGVTHVFSCKDDVRKTRIYPLTA